MLRSINLLFFIFFTIGFCPSNTYGKTPDNSPIIISIAGCTGSGKTTFAKNLLSVLGEQVSMISQDDYYKDLSHLSIKERKKLNFADPKLLDFELLITHLKALKTNQTIKKPIYNFTIHSRRKNTELISSKPVILLEGTLLLAIPEIRELSDIKLFIDVPHELRIFRYLTRDIEQRDRNINFIKKQYIDHIYPVEIELIRPSKKYADLIIPHGGKNKIALQILVEKLKAVLANSTGSVTKRVTAR
jgi:uridine kinase